MNFGPRLVAGIGLLSCFTGSSVDARAEEPPGKRPDAIDIVAEDEPRPTRGPHDPTAASFSIGKSVIEQPGITTSDALETVPGAQVFRGGGTADLATVSLRGASSAQTPIYLAGIELNDEVTGSVDLSTIPVSMVGRAHVYRGHSPAAASQMAIGGAIFFEPRFMPTTSEDEALQTLYRLGLTVGSFGHHTQRLELGIGHRDASALLSYRQARAQGNFPFIDDGATRFDSSDDTTRERSNADHGEHDLWSLAHFRHDKVRLTTIVNVFDRRAGVPGLQLPGTQHVRSRFHRLLAGANLQAPCLADSPHCLLQVTSNILRTSYTLHDPYGELGASGRQRIASHRFAQRLGVFLSPTRWLHLQVTGQYASHGLDLSQSKAPHARATRHRLRPSVMALLEPAKSLKINAQASMRCDRLSAAFTPSPFSTTPATLCPELEGSGRLGARWSFHPRWSAFANAGRYSRSPSLGELYGTSAIVLGNPSLRAERGTSVELGAETTWQSKHARGWAQAVLYARYADDLIAYRRSSFGTIKPYNIGAARVLGAELATGAKLFDHLSITLTSTLLDPRDITPSRPQANDLLPLQSRLALSPSLQLHSSPWRRIRLDQASFGAVLHYRSTRNTDPAGLVRLDPQTTLDLQGALRFDRHVHLLSRLSNLLDQRRYDLIGYPLAGRAWHASAELLW